MSHDPGSQNILELCQEHMALQSGDHLGLQDTTTEGQSSSLSQASATTGSHHTLMQSEQIY